jgi:hypothetical protein
MVLSSIPISEAEEPLFSGHGPVSFPSHQPFRINNETDLLELVTDEGFVGSGTELDPYQLIDMSIDGDGKSLGIYIGNTSSHVHFNNINITNVLDLFSVGFHISNCTNITLNKINSSFNTVGMNVVSSRSIKVQASIFGSNDKGFMVYNSNDLELRSSEIKYNDQDGVYLSGRNLTISDCTIISNGLAGIKIDTLHDYTITHCDINSNGWKDEYGIGGIFHRHFVTSGGMIDNCTLVDNYGYGMYLKNGNSEDENIKSTVENNTLINNSIELGYLFSFKNNIIKNSNPGISCWIGNDILFNHVHACNKGIGGGQNSRIIGNKVENSSTYGIHSWDSVVFGNIIRNITGNGIQDNSGGMTRGIIENNLIDNCSENGIYIEGKDTIIRDNLISRSGINGIGMNGENITTVENVISDNLGNAISLDSAKDVQILGDHIYENNGSGVYGNCRGYLYLDGVDIHDNNWHGFWLSNSEDVIVRDSTFSYHYFGNIFLQGCNNITIDKVSTFSTEIGADISYSENIMIMDSNFFDLGLGLHIEGIESIEMRNNQFQGCGPNFKGGYSGVFFDFSKVDMDSTNQDQRNSNP